METLTIEEANKSVAFILTHRGVPHAVAVTKAEAGVATLPRIESFADGNAEHVSATDVKNLADALFGPYKYGRRSNDAPDTVFGADNSPASPPTIADLFRQADEATAAESFAARPAATSRPAPVSASTAAPSFASFAKGAPISKGPLSLARRLELDALVARDLSFVVSKALASKPVAKAAAATPVVKTSTKLDDLRSLIRKAGA